MYSWFEKYYFNSEKKQIAALEPFMVNFSLMLAKTVQSGIVLQGFDECEVGPKLVDNHLPIIFALIIMPGRAILLSFVSDVALHKGRNHKRNIVHWRFHHLRLVQRS